MKINHMFRFLNTAESIMISGQCASNVVRSMLLTNKQQLQAALFLWPTSYSLVHRMELSSEPKTKKQKEKTKKKLPTELALAHFDDFYASVFQKRWPSIRIALLSPNKFCAVVNSFSSANAMVAKELKAMSAINLRSYYEYRLKRIQKRKQHADSSHRKDLDQSATGNVSPTSSVDDTDVISDAKDVGVGDETCSDNSAASADESEEEYGDLLEDDAEAYQNFVNASMNDFVPVTKLKYREELISEEEYYSFYKPQSEMKFEFEDEGTLLFPSHLNVFVFPRGDVSDFPAPKKDTLNIFNYYLMDGASVLPPLVLGVNPGDVVGDLCAAPGGKALTMLFSLVPSKIICSDKNYSRVKRMKSVFDSYLPSMEFVNKTLSITNRDVLRWSQEEAFDKILLDVPCTNDRHSLYEDENNIFSQGRLKERIQVPQMQKSLLSHALRLLKPNGSLVYSTCSLSPIQNDGVVHMALKEVWEETRLTFVIKNISQSLYPLRGLYMLKPCQYGQLVVPFLPCNFGPMYISKITRKPG